MSDRGVSLQLPAGSFDLADLHEIGENIAQLPADQQESAAQEALAKANNGKGIGADADTSGQDGFKTVARHHTIAGQGDDAVRVHEHLRVFDPATDEAPAEEATAKSGGAETDAAPSTKKRGR